MCMTYEWSSFIAVHANIVRVELLWTDAAVCADIHFLMSPASALLPCFCLASDTFCFVVVKNSSEMQHKLSELLARAVHWTWKQHLKRVSHTGFWCTKNYPDKDFLGKEKNIYLILSFLWWSGKSRIVPKLAEAQAKCPGLAYGNKAFNLQAAEANFRPGETLQKVISARPVCKNTAWFSWLCDVWITWSPYFKTYRRQSQKLF